MTLLDQILASGYILISKDKPTKSEFPLCIKNPFDWRNRPGSSWTIVLLDLDRPGCFVARYPRSLEPVGLGATEYEAVENLKSQTTGES